MYSSPALKAFHELSFWAIRNMRLEPMNPPYKVTIWFHAPKNVHRYDIANYEKAVNDALVKGGLITDDCKIDELILIRSSKTDEGFVMVKVDERMACNFSLGVV